MEPTPESGAPRSTNDPRERVEGYLSLRAMAAVFEDVQRTRIAIENRVRTAPIDAELVGGSLEGLRATEHQLGLMLRRTYRTMVEAEIVAWQKATPGIGEHLLARLLGAIGHPVHTRVHAWEGTGPDRVLVVVGDVNRRVSDLWSYCGHGDATRRRRRGMTAEQAAATGNTRAKVITHLLAESCLKQKARSPYGPVYDAARERYQDREGWTAGHQHAAALRLVGKELLRDLWRAARSTQEHHP